MVSYKGQSSYVTLWIFYLLVGVVPGVVSDVELTSIPSTVQPICPGKAIEFTCMTTQSSILLWTSDEYIGVNSQFQFRLFDPIGTTRSSTDATANLTAVNGDILTSTLHIAMISNNPSSTVTCINSGLGTSNTSTVQVAAVPGAPRNVTAVGSLEDCMIQVTWKPPAGTRGSNFTYRVDIPSRNIMTSSNLTKSTLHVPDCADDIRVHVFTVNSYGCTRSTEAQLRLQSRSSTSQLGAGAIAGIVIGSSLFSCFFCIIFCCCFICIVGSSHESKQKKIKGKNNSGPGAHDLSTTNIIPPEAHDLSTTNIIPPEVHDLSNTNIIPPEAHDLSTANPHDQKEEVDYEKLQEEAIVEIKKLYKDFRTAIMQALEDYQNQSKHDINELGTEKDRIKVPIWIDNELDDGWKDSLREAVQAINEAAPGLSLSIIEDKKQAIIYVLAIDEKKAETKGNIQIRSTPGQADYITKIHLGKLEDDTKEGISTRELFHALGFHQIDNLGLTRFDPLSIMLYQSKEAYESAQRKHPGDPVWLLTNPFEGNTKLSELDKVCLNLVYRPCRYTTDTSTGYEPKLGKNGMYYCERHVMSAHGHTYPGSNYCDGMCGPDDGPNCPACRTMKNEKVKEILDGGKWQGMTGLVYCGTQFTEPTVHHDGICGIDNGLPCHDCIDLLR